MDDGVEVLENVVEVELVALDVFCFEVGHSSDW